VAASGIFGCAVNVNAGGSRVHVAAGSRNQDHLTTNDGSVYVYSRDGTTGEWAEEAELVPGEPHAVFDDTSEFFG
jgi:hypothetical protein